MRTVDVGLGGDVYAMPVSFAAMEQIAERVGDPFGLAIGMTKGEILTAVQTVDTITIGARLAGCKLERSRIGELIVEAGAQDVLQVASAYIIALVSGGPAIPTTSKKKTSK